MKKGKAIVIYSSKRGATKRYAEWIADELECDYVAIETSDLHSLEQFDVIVYGGWLRGSGIVGFDIIKSSDASQAIFKKLVLFADGIATNTKENFEQIKEVNYIEGMEEVPLFVIGGAYDPAKVKGIDKMMMKVAKKVVSSGKTSEGDESAKEMVDSITNGVNKVSEDQIIPIIKEAQKYL